MKTWNDYKEYVRTVDPETAKDIKETEEVAAIVTAMVEQRNALGLSQRELAAMCGLPQFRNIHIIDCPFRQWVSRLEFCLCFHIDNQTNDFFLFCTVRRFRCDCVKANIVEQCSLGQRRVLVVTTLDYIC